METLHDLHTICDKEGMMLSLALSEALDELDKAREEGDEKGEMILNDHNISDIVFLKKNV